MRTHKAVAIAVATLGMMVGGAASPARAARVVDLGIKGVTVPPGGYVYCIVSASSRRPVNLRVDVLDGSLAPLDDGDVFGTTFRSGSGPYFVETRAGAFSQASEDVDAACSGVIEGKAAEYTFTACACLAGSCNCE